MKLAVGICGFQPGYEIILKQEGIPFRTISEDYDFEKEDFAVIILGRNAVSRKEKIMDFLHSGGFVLSEAEIFAELFHLRIKTKKVDYLIAEEKSDFSEVGFADIFGNISIIKDAKSEFLDKNLQIRFRKIGNGGAIILPFDVNLLITDFRSMRKKFYYPRKEQPSEIVAKISKAKIRKIVMIALRSLFFRNNLPLVRLSYFPENWKSIFIFRLDTDFCSFADAEKMYEICRQNDIRATWFLDTESDEKIKQYAAFKNQELALHCYKHKVYDTERENFANLEIGVRKLEKAGVKPVGFAAPFGDWNLALAHALEKMKFFYSSEFTLDYDNLPFFPFVAGKFSSVLQIPIHPVSLGRLRRSHFSENEMLQYFRQVIRQKYEKREPIIIYHHPHHLHFNIFDAIFKEVSEFENLGFLTMTEFAQWWKFRSNLQIFPEFSHNKILLKKENLNKNVSLEVQIPQGVAYLNMEKSEIDLDEIDFQKEKSRGMKVDYKYLHKKGWREFLYDWETRRNKKK